MRSLFFFVLAASTALAADPMDATFDRAGIGAVALSDLAKRDSFRVTQDGEDVPWSIDKGMLVFPVNHAGVVRILAEDGAPSEVKGEDIGQAATKSRVPRQVERIEKDLVFDRLECADLALADTSGGPWLWMPVENGTKVAVPWREWRKTVKVRVRLQPMRTPRVKHDIEVWFEGKKACDAKWEGGEPFTAEFDFESDKGAGEKTLEFRTQDGAAPRVIASGPVGDGPAAYLDWIEIDGPRIPDSGQASWISDRAIGTELVGLDGKKYEIVFVRAGRVLNPPESLGVDGPVRAATRAALLKPAKLERHPASKDPEKGVAWLAIGPAAFKEALAPLVERRQSQGLDAAFVSIEEACPGDLPRAEALRRFIQHAATAWPEPKLKFVLLVGDAERGGESGVPCGERDALGAGWTATDGWYARVDEDELPDLAVGRWPAHSPEEAAALLTKVKRFEDAPPGEWRRRLHLALGTAGFGQQMDGMLKTGGMQLASDLVPEAFAFHVQSTLELDLPFTYPPRDYNAFLTQRVNDGCLVLAYSGHGWEHGLQSLKWGGKRYPILDVELAKKLDAKNGLPMAMFFACLTGSFDEKEDCLCEAVVRPAGGPVVAIGSSGISHPYADIIFAKELMTTLFVKRAPTIGQGVMAAKRRALKPAEGDAMRGFLDGMAEGAVGGAKNQARFRLDGSMAYNLFGDPATRIPWPGKASVECAKKTSVGGKLAVTGTAELGDGTAVVTLEAGRLKSLEPVEKVDVAADDAEAVMKRNWKRMNEPIAARIEAVMKEGKFDAEIEVPAGIPQGEYILKVYANDGKADAIASRRVKIGK